LDAYKRGDIAGRKVVGRVAGVDNETYLLALLP